MTALAPLNIRHEEVSSVVWWQVPHSPERMAMADFVAVLEGDHELIAVRLVRVRLGEASIGRADVLRFEQPLAEWEEAAADTVRRSLLDRQTAGAQQ